MKTTLELLKARGIDPVTMPKKIKSKWLKALRSGEYEQATGALYDKDGGKNGSSGFCCLGVLQHCLTGGVEVDKHDEPRGLPTDEWLDDWNIIDNGDFNVYYGSGVTGLAALNDDSGLSFKQIANIIEKQVIGV